MADIAWDDVTAHAADLTSIDAVAKADILTWVNSEALDPAVFGDETTTKYKLARIYLAAHFGTLANADGGGAAGPIKRKKAGDLEVEYASFSASDPTLGTTIWGRAYLALLKRSVARVPFLV